MSNIADSYARYRSRWIPAFAGMTIVIFLLSFSPAHCEPEIGQPTPALAGQELGGTAFDIANLRGKVVVVHFWATWCPSCREEMVVLDRFYKKFHDEGTEVIAISIDKPRNRKEVMEMIKAFGFPAAMASELTANGFGSPSSVPVTYIVDKTGVVRAHITPEEEILSERALAARVGPLLGK